MRLVIPAQAGIQGPRTYWIPACARMTTGGALDPRDKPEDDD